MTKHDDLTDCSPSSRRRVGFVLPGVAFAAALFLALTGGATRVSAAEAPECAEPNELWKCISPPAPGQPLRELDVIRSENGVLDTALDIRYFEDVLIYSKPDGPPNRRDLRMYGYPKDGKWTYTLPGPIYRIRKGDNFKLKLKNSLTEENGAPQAPLAPDGCNADNKVVGDAFPNCFHGNNVTNFHFHGFHISPLPPHDNIFLKLEPGEEYTVISGPIPDNQAEGTHWYHPHHHGATALQLLNGMAGAFIVEVSSTTSSTSSIEASSKSRSW